MQRLVNIDQWEDIFPEYRETPIGLLLAYHNLVNLLRGIVVHSCS